MASIVSTDSFISNELDTRIATLEQEFDSHVIAFSGPLMGGTEKVFRSAIEGKIKQRPRKNKLVVILTTTGGYAEVVDRIVDTMRKHYRVVDFVIPDYAYSAGTILAMSGNAIHMDYFSRLGPIDPQIPSSGTGFSISALGYLERYEDLMKKARDPNYKLSSAEMAIILNFDQGDLHFFTEARELSIELLKKWLVRYKFKDWKTTKTRKKRVTLQMKKERAEEIARKLNDTKKWHSHGYGISKDVLNKMKCLIDDLDASRELGACIREYHELFSDFMAKLGIRGVVHYYGNFRPFLKSTAS